MKLSFIIDELIGTRGFNRNAVESIVIEGIRSAYHKKYPQAQFRVDYDKKSDTVSVKISKTVVAHATDALAEISLRKARATEDPVEVGDQVWVPFEGTIGRIEILHAKQIIASQIKKIEAHQIYERFRSKQGTIVHGIIHKCDRNGVYVKIQDVIAFLPKGLSVPADKCFVGHTIRALLKEVLEEPQGDSQLILDRSSAFFVQRLLELDIPEVFEQIVVVTKVERIPGYKTKVVVMSNDTNIDPVGTCIGAF
ncbi:MAG: NusA N-terminal domain-containing protein [Candidatus Babeliales bacterium]